MKKGWERKRLGEVCEFLNRGVSPKYVETGGVIVLNQRCIRDHRVNYEIARRHDVTAKGVKADRFVQAGDVLVNSTGEGTLGRVAQLRESPSEPATVDSHVTIVRPKPGLFFPEFFGYALRDIETELQKSGEGCGGQTELNRSVLAEKFLVRFPSSLSEQRRIVGVLDEAFAGLARAQANAARNLQNARALFESHLQAVFSQRGKGWVEKRLGEAFETTTGTTPPKGNPALYGDFMPFVKPPELRDGILDSATDNLSSLGAAVARTLPPKSILVSCIGNLGKIGFNALPVAFNQQINAILPNENVALPEMMFFQARSQSFKEQLEALASGTTVPIVNKSKFNSVRIVLPPLPEQRRIATQLDALSGETRRLAGVYERQLAALGELKQALLHRAFAGEL